MNQVATIATTYTPGEPHELPDQTPERFNGHH